MKVESVNIDREISLERMERPSMLIVFGQLRFIFVITF